MKVLSKEIQGGDELFFKFTQLSHKIIIQEAPALNHINLLLNFELTHLFTASALTLSQWLN